MVAEWSHGNNRALGLGGAIGVHALVGRPARAVRLAPCAGRPRQPEPALVAVPLTEPSPAAPAGPTSEAGAAAPPSRGRSAAPSPPPPPGAARPADPGRGIARSRVRRRRAAPAWRPVAARAGRRGQRPRRRGGQVQAPAAAASSPPVRIAGELTNADYRRAGAPAGAAGTVVVGFRVRADGAVDRCGVLRSSGVAVFDAATCRLIEQRFRFRPAPRRRRPADRLRDPHRLHLAAALTASRGLAASRRCAEPSGCRSRWERGRA